MKQTIIPCLLILALFASYTLGQAARKPAPKNCCCEHVQEICEILKRIEKNGIKSQTGSGDGIFSPGPATFDDPGDVTVPNFGSGHVDDLPDLRRKTNSTKKPN